MYDYMQRAHRNHDRTQLLSPWHDTVDSLSAWSKTECSESMFRARKGRQSGSNRAPDVGLLSERCELRRARAAHGIVHRRSRSLRRRRPRVTCSSAHSTRAVLSTESRIEGALHYLPWAQRPMRTQHTMH